MSSSGYSRFGTPVDLQGLHKGDWIASTAYRAKDTATLPNGFLARRNAAGNSRATFDATEKAAWTPVTKFVGESFRWHGGSPLNTGAANSAALTLAITAARAVATNPALAYVYIEPGVYIMGPNSISSRCTFFGYGAKFVADAGSTWGGSTTDAMLQAVQGASAQYTRVFGLEIDMVPADPLFPAITTARNAYGIKLGGNCSFSHMKDVIVRNPGKGGICFVAHSSDPTNNVCVNPVVENCRIVNTGVGNLSLSTAYGISFENCSEPVARGNNIKAQCFGVLFQDAPDFEVVGGRITMTRNDVGFEAIGAPSGSSRGRVLGVSAHDTWDNGFSITSSDCLIEGNLIDTTQNHGIYCGSRCRVIGNRIRNIGRGYDGISSAKIGGGSFGAIRPAGSTIDCYIAGNVVIESRNKDSTGIDPLAADLTTATPTAQGGYRTGSIVKQVGGGAHTIVDNIFSPETSDGPGAGCLYGADATPATDTPYDSVDGSTKVVPGHGSGRMQNRGTVGSGGGPLGNGPARDVYIVDGGENKAVTLGLARTFAPGQLHTIKNQTTGFSVTVTPGAGDTIDLSTAPVVLGAGPPKAWMTLIRDTTDETRWSRIG